jgi:4-amino-4-deoxy-L-arabinose transferase-like glycosyltransferase
MLVIGLAALVMRIAYVVGYAPHRLPLADGLWYHTQANDIAAGRWFIDPLARAFLDETRATAAHPPLFPLVLAATSFFGGTSLLAHQIAESFLEATAVVVIALVAREVAGDRAGIIAAAIAAVYPRLWANEGEVLSESLFGLTIALMLFAAYRFWSRPRLRTAAIFGFTAGIAALCRGEALLFLPLLVVPLLFAVPRTTRRQRARLLAAAAGGALVALAPWTVANLLRFERPVLISTSFGYVIAGANCDATYHGEELGGWRIDCASPDVAGDESERAEVQRRLGIDYALDHADRLPVVVAVRVAHLWDLYQPGWGEEGGAAWTDGLETAGFYALVPLAIAGALVLRRRHDFPVFPLVVPAVAVTLTAALMWGSPRFRLPADVAFIVLAGVALDAASRNATGRSHAVGNGHGGSQTPGCPLPQLMKQSQRSGLEQCTTHRGRSGGQSSLVVQVKAHGFPLPEVQKQSPSVV